MTRNVVAARPDESIADAARLMCRHRIGAVPVVEHSHVVGIVTRTDLLQAFVELITFNDARERGWSAAGPQPPRAHGAAPGGPAPRSRRAR
jgi:CBS-domain-containing membrane protein